jgi:hypothetical protein
MVDFAKLRSMTPADRAAQDEQRREDEYRFEVTKRAELSKASVVITLTEDAEMRFNSATEKRVLLIGTNDRGQPTRAVYIAPSFTTDGDVYNLAASLVAGKKMQLNGHWLKRRWKDRAGKNVETWEFQTMTIIDLD